MPKQYDEILTEMLAGVPSAMLEFNLLFIQNRFNSKDIVKTIHLLKNELSKNNPNAMWAYALMHHYEVGLKKDYDKIQQLLEDSVKLGHAYAMKDLAYVYFYIRKYKFESAKKLYDNAIKGGCNLANSGLGILYDTQFIGDAKFACAVAKECYEIAIELGDSEAAYHLALLYQYGKIDGQPNYVQAEKYYEIASERGSIGAAFNLAALYYVGKIDGQPNYVQAEKYYKIASERGSTRAAFNLAAMHELGQIDGQPNYAQAKKYYEIVQDNCHESSDAQDVKFENSKLSAFFLALLYETGKIDGQPNYAQARKYYDIAIGHGHTLSAHNLGALYYKGHITGVQDLVMAEQCFRIAVAFGDIDSNLALIHICCQKIHNLFLEGQLGVKDQTLLQEAISLYLSFMDAKIKNNENFINDVLLTDDLLSIFEHLCTCLDNFKDISTSNSEIKSKLTDIFKDRFNTYQDGKSNTLLHLALMIKTANGNNELARFLIDIGFDLNIVNAADMTPFELAASLGLTELAMMMMEKDAEIRTHFFPKVPKAATLARQNGHASTADAIQNKHMANNFIKYSNDQEMKFMNWAEASSASAEASAYRAKKALKEMLSNQTADQAKKPVGKHPSNLAEESSPHKKKKF